MHDNHDGPHRQNPPRPPALILRYGHGYYGGYLAAVLLTLGYNLAIPGEQLPNRMAKETTYTTDLTLTPLHAVLCQIRTEEGRELRKRGIEAFKYKARYPRTDGISNTLTLVAKDNYLLCKRPKYE